MAATGRWELEAVSVKGGGGVAVEETNRNRAVASVSHHTRRDCSGALVRLDASIAGFHQEGRGRSQAAQVTADGLTTVFEKGEHRKHGRFTV